LGSGNKYSPLAVNIDVVAAVNPDIVHNLDCRPWPLPDNHFAEVWAYDVIEHLGDVVAVMEEIHRVCRDGAVIKITVPHFSCCNAFTDITHRHFFSARSFDYFTGDNEFGFYTNRRFRKVRGEIIFHRSLTNKLVWRFTRRFPEAYERRWAWTFPAWFLSFELAVVKPDARS
jgi:SAM-dependent methyltransferase